MEELVSADFKLGAHGWASFRLAIGSALIDIGPFGYGTDALGDLVRAALMVVSSGCEAEVTFDGEPQEWRLLLGADPCFGFARKSLPVRFKTFPNAGLRAPEIDGSLIFEAETTADQFGRAIELAAQSVWDRYGAEGYHKAWHPSLKFPMRALSALILALSIEDPPSVGA